MPLVPAICPQCNAKISIDDNSKTAFCSYCGTSFVSEKAINNYNVTNNFPNANVSITQDSEYENLRKKYQYYSENGDNSGAFDCLKQIKDKYPYNLTDKDKEVLDREYYIKNKLDKIFRIENDIYDVSGKDRLKEMLTSLDEIENEVKQRGYADRIEDSLKRTRDKGQKKMEEIEARIKKAENESISRTLNVILGLAFWVLVIAILFGACGSCA